jgi:hypothetical protein
MSRFDTLTSRTTEHFIQPDPIVAQHYANAGRTAIQTGAAGSVYRDASFVSPYANGKVATVFFWIKWDGVDPGVGERVLWQSNGSTHQFLINLTTAGANKGQISMGATDNVGSTASDINSSTARIAINKWTAVMASWDLATIAGADNFYLYLQQHGEAVGGNIEDHSASVNIDQAVDDLTEADYWGHASFTGYHNMCITQMMVHFGSALDFSSSTVRENFVSADGQAQDLGPNASDALGADADFWVPNGDVKRVGASLVSGFSAAVPVAGPGV